MSKHSDAIPRKTGKYNDWEKHIIRSLYPTGGTTAVRARFHKAGYDRPAQGIWAKANDLGVEFGQKPGYVRLNEMFFNDVRGKRWIEAKARQDGVLVECGTSATGKGCIHLVPEWWAMNAFTEITDSLALWDSPEWVGLVEAADMLGVTQETLRRAVTGKEKLARLNRSMKDVPNRKDVHGRWLFRRYEMQMAVRSYRELRRRAKYAPPTKEAA